MHTNTCDLVLHLYIGILHKIKKEHTSSTATDHPVSVHQFAVQDSLCWYQISHADTSLTCLLAKTSSTASLSSSSFSIRLISSLASPIRSLSLLSTTNIRPGIEGGGEGGEEGDKRKREGGDIDVHGGTDRKTSHHNLCGSTSMFPCTCTHIQTHMPTIVIIGHKMAEVWTLIPGNTPLHI